MSLRSAHASRERQGLLTGLLWGLAGLGLFALTLFGTRQDMGVLTLALLVVGIGAFVVLFRPEFGVIVLTSTFFLSYPAVLEGDGRLTINNMLGLMLGGILIATMTIERRADFLRSGHLWLFFAIGVLVILNQLATADITPPDSFASLDLSEKRVQGIITKIAFTVFVVRFVRTRSQLTLLALMIVAFVMITAPNAIWNAVTSTGDQIEKIRAYADFGIRAAKNANRLAFMCAIGIAITGHAMQEYRKRWVTWAGGAAIGVMIAAIILSASRSGLLNLIVLGVIFARKRGIRPRTILALLLLLALLPLVAIVTSPQGPIDALTEPGETLREFILRVGGNVISPAYLDRATNFLAVERGEEGSGSSRARLGLLELGARMYADHPWVGVGIGNFRWVSILEYGSDRISALHNSYLLTLIEGGVMLFIPYLALYWFTWRNLELTRRRAAENDAVGARWLVEAVQAIFIMFLIFSVFADLWHDIYPFLIIGFAAVLGRLYANPGETARA